MVNLLPLSVQRTLRLGYYLRLATGLFFALALVCVVGVASLLPAYLTAQSEVALAEEYIALAQGTTDTRDKASANQTMALLAERVKIMNEYHASSSAALVIAALIEELPSEVSLQRISLRYAKPGEGSMSISGISKTRSALLAYAQALQRESTFTGVSVPVEQLASDSNIAFSLSFTFAIQP